MATTAQINANRQNARQSTGPRTAEGKAEAARNRITHGLAGRFTFLRGEDPEAFKQLLDSYLAEYLPATPTERFLVTELAQAEWRLRRADTLEAELMNPGGTASPTDVAPIFRYSDRMMRLDRYIQSARRAWHKAHDKLRALAREQRAHTQKEPPAPSPNPSQPAKGPVPVESAAPMPVHLQRELTALRRRDPDFDPKLDASQMSRELRRWYEKAAA